MQQHDIFFSRIPEFAKLLDNIEQAPQRMSDYSLRYLRYLLKHRLYFLHIYASVLQTAMRRSEKAFSEVSLVDYGAGNGLLGMFAKYCGCKAVFLCDTDKNFVEAAEITTGKLGIIIEGIVHGDIRAFYNRNEKEVIDWVIGTDVIEHIYDLDQFFDTVVLMNPEMLTVFTTASNPDNYLKVRKLRKMQLSDELFGGDPSDFELAGAVAHPPYLKMREDIIKEFKPGLSQIEVLRLATLTRGKNKADILLAVNGYLATGKSPKSLTDRWNTCHPLTGSWSERILAISEYQSIYNQHGFRLSLSNGFYDSYSSTSKQLFNFFRNLLMKIMGKKIAPFITLTGFTNRRNTDIC